MLRFVISSRPRRAVAILFASGLLTGMISAAPPAPAAEDPKADFTASFNACAGAAVTASVFTDVEEGHSNIGDIDCIA